MGDEEVLTLTRTQLLALEQAGIPKSDITRILAKIDLLVASKKLTRPYVENFNIITQKLIADPQYRNDFISKRDVVF